MTMRVSDAGRWDGTARGTQIEAVPGSPAHGLGTDAATGGTTTMQTDRDDQRATCGAVMGRPLDGIGVTHSSKCYTFICVVCRGLSQSSRRHTITCSGACRVRLHREPAITAHVAQLRRIAESTGTTLPNVLQAHAVKTLRPDLFAELGAGTLSLDDAQPAIGRAFVDQLLSALAEGG
jgi:hypothetical protein